MPLQIVQGDISKIPCNAIVNAAKPSLLGGGGIDGAIHKAAGAGLFLECLTLCGCKVGQAKITNGCNLPAQYVVHTIGPKWCGGKLKDREKLYSCYIESLKLAASKGCTTVVFPLISAGDYGYPEEQALQVATDAINEFLSGSDITVTKTSKVMNTLVIILLIAIVVFFPKSNLNFIRGIDLPIGPGGMVDPSGNWYDLNGAVMLVKKELEL